MEFDDNGVDMEITTPSIGDEAGTNVVDEDDCLLSLVELLTG